MKKRSRTSLAIAALSVITVLAPSVASSSPAQVNPFALPVVTHYLSQRPGLITAAVFDVSSGKTYLYHPGLRGPTASIIKIDILADLLYQAQLHHTWLSPSVQATATSMIEYSDNDSATDLWNLAGGEPAIAAFDKMIGYSQTIYSEDWGEVETTPTDQLKLLKIITLPNKVLDPRSQSYEKNLMEHVASYERFGLGWGTPAPALVGLKNGWYPEASGWQTNTTGFVKIGARFYLVAIMISKNATETDGTSTLTALSNLIYRTLKP